MMGIWLVGKLAVEGMFTVLIGDILCAGFELAGNPEQLIPWPPAP